MVGFSSSYQDDAADPIPALGSEDLFTLMKAHIADASGVNSSPRRPKLEEEDQAGIPRQAAPSTPLHSQVALDGTNSANGNIGGAVNQLPIDTASNVQQRQSDVDPERAPVAASASTMLNGHANGHSQPQGGLSPANATYDSLIPPVATTSTQVPSEPRPEVQETIPTTSSPPAEVPEIKEEIPSSPKLDATYRVFPSHRHDSTSDEEEDELLDEDDDLGDTSGSPSHDQPNRLFAQESEEDDEGSEKTESETSENERVAIQLTGSATNTPSRQRSPRPYFQAIPAGSPSHTTSSRLPNVPTAPERLFDGKIFQTWLALTSGVAMALDLPPAQLKTQFARATSVTRDDTGERRQLHHLTCPEPACGAGARVTSTSRGASTELWEIIAHTTRHARSCRWAQHEERTSNRPTSAATQRQSALTRDTNGAEKRKKAREASVPAFTAGFHPQIMMPRRKRKKDQLPTEKPSWVAGVCCRACIQHVLEQEQPDSALIAPLHRIQRGSSTQSDIMLLSQDYRWRTMAVPTSHASRCAHILKTCFRKDAWPTEVVTRAMASAEKRRKTKKEYNAQNKHQRATSKPPAPSHTVVTISPVGHSLPLVAAPATFTPQPTVTASPHRAIHPSEPAVQPPIPDEALSRQASLETLSQTDRDRKFAAQLLERDASALHNEGSQFRCPNWDAIDESRPPSTLNWQRTIHTYCAPVHGCPALVERSEAANGEWVFKLEHSDFCMSLASAGCDSIKHWSNEQQRAQALAEHFAKQAKTGGPAAADRLKVPSVSVTAASPIQTVAQDVTSVSVARHPSPAQQPTTSANGQNRSGNPAKSPTPMLAAGSKASSTAPLRTPSPSAFEARALQPMAIEAVYDCEADLREAAGLYLKQEPSVLHEHRQRKELRLSCCNDDIVYGPDAQSQIKANEYACDAWVRAIRDSHTKSWEVVECDWKHSAKCIAFTEEVTMPNRRRGISGDEDEDLQRALELSRQEHRRQEREGSHSANPVASSSRHAHVESDEAMARRLAEEEWGGDSSHMVTGLRSVSDARRNSSDEEVVSTLVSKTPRKEQSSANLDQELPAKMPPAAVQQSPVNGQPPTAGSSAAGNGPERALHSSLTAPTAADRQSRPLSISTTPVTSENTSMRTFNREHAVLRANPLFSRFYQSNTPASARLVTALGAANHDDAVKALDAADPQDVRIVLMDLALGRPIPDKLVLKPRQVPQTIQPGPVPKSSGMIPAPLATSPPRAPSPELEEPPRVPSPQKKLAVGQRAGNIFLLLIEARALSAAICPGSSVSLHGTRLLCRYYGRAAQTTCKFQLETKGFPPSHEVVVTEVQLLHGTHCHLPPDQFPDTNAVQEQGSMDADLPDPGSDPETIDVPSGPALIEQSGQPASSEDEASVVVGSQSAAKPASVETDGFAVPRAPGASPAKPARLTHKNLQRLRHGAVGPSRSVPSTTASEVSTVASPRKRAAGEPRKIKKRGMYNSEHDFYTEVRKYSKFEAPFAKLTEPKPSNGRYVIRCAHPDCAFYVEGEHLRDEDDGSELQGVVVRKVRRHHCETCQTASKAPSRLASSFAGSLGKAQGTKRKRKAVDEDPELVEISDSPSVAESPALKRQRTDIRATRRRIEESSPIVEDAEVDESRALPLPSDPAEDIQDKPSPDPSKSRHQEDLPVAEVVHEDVQLRPPVSAAGLVPSTANQACNSCRLLRRRCDRSRTHEVATCVQCEQDGFECRWAASPSPASRLIVCDGCRSGRRRCEVAQLDSQGRRCRSCIDNALVCTWQQADVAKERVRRQGTDISEIAHGEGGSSPENRLPSSEGSSTREEVVPAKAPVTEDTYDSRDDFNRAVEAHSSSVNPGSQLAFTDDEGIRFRAACLRPGCSYSFNASVSALGPEAKIIVRRNTPKHSHACLQWHRDVRDGTQEAVVDAPQAGTVIEDWIDFVEQVKYHSNYVNEGCELKVLRQKDICKVWCPERDLGCKYYFSAQFLISNIHEGSVDVRKVVDKHSLGCWNHHQRTCKNLPILEDSTSDSDAVGTSIIRRRHSTALCQPPADPTAPRKGDVFESRDEFRQIIEAHTARVNPGSSLVIKDKPLSYSLECRNFFTGCRYEFYCTYEDADYADSKLVLDSTTPSHHEMCVAELVLRKLRPPPEETKSGRRTRRAARPTSFSAFGNNRSTGSPASVGRQEREPKRAPQKRKRVVASGSSNDAANESDDISIPLPKRPPQQSTTRQLPLVPAGHNEQEENEEQEEDDEQNDTPLTDDSRDVADLAALPATSTSQAPRPAPQTDPLDRPLDYVLSGQLATYLASMGYKTTGDLKRTGLTKTDWPDFLEWCADRLHAQEEARMRDLDPVNCFLLNRRANIAIAREGKRRRLSISSHHHESSDDE